MMHTRPTTFILALTLAGIASAQSPQSAAPKVAVRQLAAPTTSSTEVLGSLAAVRQLPNGNVLVNDQARRRVLLMDSSLKVLGMVADSTSSTANAYGAQAGGLLAYRGDSTLFVDPASLSMLVIDPSGKIIRTMAAPRPNDVMFLTGGAFGNPGFDAQGRLVYRTIERRMGARLQPGQPIVSPTLPDSSVLVRFDLGTRKLDTVGFFKIPKPNMSMTRSANGDITGVTVIMNPLPVVDDWVVLSDGTVAFVRGHDYHVDFVDAAGAVTRAEKIPYEWQRMTDDDKSRFIDSAKVAMEKQRAAAAAAGPSAARPGDLLGSAVGGMTTMVTVTRNGDGPPVVTAGAGAGPGGAAAPPVNMIAPSELPDYKPVFGPGAIRADMDGHIWVRTIPTKVLTGGAIYDVIDRSGKLVDRVQVPTGTTIAGFGAGGVVYLGMRDASGVHIQRIRVK